MVTVYIKGNAVSVYEEEAALLISKGLATQKPEEVKAIEEPISNKMVKKPKNNK